MGDVGKFKTLYWLLPTSAALILARFWTEAISSPLIVCLITVIVFVGVFVSILAAVGYCELERQKKAEPTTAPAMPSNFKCDFQILRRICHLLAQIRADAVGYGVYSEAMLKRMEELNSLRAIFEESHYANTFQKFWNVACEAIDQKKSYLNPQARETFDGMLSEHYQILKTALDDDYNTPRS